MVWVDANQNGIMDAGEQPMPNIRVHADDVYHRYQEWEPAITDQEGKAIIVVRVDACPNPELNIYPDMPSGYKPTTAAPIHVKENLFGDIEYNKNYYFGFAKLP